jgi:biofilm PGA synthesis N-glycosyltransferase PgaC
MSGNAIGRFLEMICFGYPFVMAYYWMSGGLLYRWLRGRYEPLFANPPKLPEYPSVSVLLPCFNEEAQLEETLGALMRINYPDFEVIAINDGSTDRTAEMLDGFAARLPRLRVAHLARNQGKSTAMNIGALLARHEIIVATDGDALLDRNCLTWFVRRFQSDERLGGLTGNPRIRNRATLLGRLQVGEFSSIVGLIKRAQTVWGTLFTVSGVMCAFRKRSLHEAGWWNTNTLTDDVDLSWRIQLKDWFIAYEPKSICWILMPETVRGLWRQRLRWSVGGTQTVLDSTRGLFAEGRWRLFPAWMNYIVSILWAYAVVLGMACWLVSLSGIDLPESFPVFPPLPETWGIALAGTYLLQAFVSLRLDARFEPRNYRFFFWIVWYPLLFWVLQAATAVAGLPKTLFRPANRRGTWISPDRGIR